MSNDYWAPTGEERRDTQNMGGCGSVCGRQTERPWASKAKQRAKQSARETRFRSCDPEKCDLESKRYRMTFSAGGYRMSTSGGV